MSGRTFYKRTPSEMEEDDQEIKQYDLNLKEGIDNTVQIEDDEVQLVASIPPLKDGLCVRCMYPCVNKELKRVPINLSIKKERNSFLDSGFTTIKRVVDKEERKTIIRKNNAIRTALYRARQRNDAKEKDKYMAELQEDVLHLREIVKLQEEHAKARMAFIQTLKDKEGKVDKIIQVGSGLIIPDEILFENVDVTQSFISSDF
jgi:hypothetical protein